MKIGSWNCRGIGRQSLWTDIEATCKINKIQVLTLVETKSVTGPTKNRWRKAGFDNCVFSPSIGLAGGLCLLWKSYQMTDEYLKLWTFLKDLFQLKSKCLASTSPLWLYLFMLHPKKILSMPSGLVFLSTSKDVPYRAL